MKMLFPRRYIRILLLIPFTWLLVTLIFSLNDRITSTNKSSDGHKAQALVEPQQPNNNNNFRHNNEVQNLVDDSAQQLSDDNQKPIERPKMNKKSQMLREKVFFVKLFSI